MKKEEKTRLTKEKILRAAIDEFGSRGYYAASVNAVCDAGINKGLIYHNYKTKDDLYLACVKRTFDDLIRSVQDEMKNHPEISYMEARMHFFMKHEMEARLFLETAVWPPKELSGKIRSLRSGIDELNLEEFQRLLSTCTLREGVSENDAFEFFRTIQYAYNASFQVTASPDLPFDELLVRHEHGGAKFMDLMLFGIARQ